MKPQIALLSFALSAGILSGCSVKKMAIKTGADLLDKGIEALFEEKDAEFAESSLASQLKLLEVLQKNDPQNSKLLTYLSQGFGAYAFLFIEPKNPERAKIFYARGRDYGMISLNQKLKIDIRTESDQNKIEAGLKKLKKEDAPILFWTAYAWGGLAAISLDEPDTLAQLPKIAKMMARVEELHPHFFFGGPDLFLGSYYGSRPKLFGGDLEKSKAHFERAVRSSDSRFLMAKVLFARYYAVPAQDEKLYRELLGHVLDSPADILPGQSLANTLAQRRAKKLLEEIHEHF